MNTKKYTKKFSRVVVKSSLTAFLLFSVVPTLASADEVENASGRKQTFVVTAYYSPLEDQSFYIRGSYEADIRLNGGGVNAADMTPVYVGMLAAPKTYAFGTKIYIPGLGNGTVHDRGGKILVHEGYDRIDVWMGSGTEGLGRALNWGKRKVEGYVYDDPSSVSENLSFTQIPSEIATWRKVASLFAKDLFLGSSGEEVRKLQKYLKVLGFFDGSAAEEGIYGPLTQKAVLDFQISRRIIAAHSDFGAGVLGPKTRIALEEMLRDEMPSVSESGGPTISSNPLRTAIISPGMGISTKGKNVKRLQMILRSLGYFSGETTENYGNQTIEAVVAFQIDHDIINDAFDPSAGYYGQRTHVKLQEILAERKQRLESFSERKYVQIIPIPLAEVVGIPEREKLLVNSQRMKVGDKGEIVRILQLKLIAANYLEKGFDTGFFGEKTREALMKFQKDNYLIGDAMSPGAGEFGEKTKTILFNVT
ncbi:peptidoglycan-binding protein [Candidatus Peregrinibacteria bacterium]|nr:peptidoglycan-binding protein [Candidatus Peregrinibacteria bacterium]